ncbi:MAG: hydrogenase maturation nickel metallochaperone HypA [Euryarchaeota archaeon]|nr:hydrogenase maturation nickel metallochaperone HypA [Euryarchaeota archaeon]
MHELSIAADIVRCAEAALEGRRGARVLEVKVNVGQLSFVGRRQLLFAFDTIKDGTRLRGAKLRITHSKARVSCRGCGYEGAIKIEKSGGYVIPLIACPKCEGPVEIISGNGYNIASMTIDTEEENAKRERGGRAHRKGD